MKCGPSIAPVAALAGDPARANMLAALMAGQALTACELAGEAGITAQTASSHLAKLQNGGLVSAVKQGRHRYFRLAGTDVAEMLETMAGVAARAGHVRTRTGPREPALRKARVCYDHLAGEMGVRMFDAMVRGRLIAVRTGELRLTRAGESFVTDFAGAVPTGSRRPLCRSCLDWSQRRTHLAGAVGTVLLNRMLEMEWARREKNSRALIFSPRGEVKFNRLFAL